MKEYIYVLIFLVVGIGFVLLSFFGSWLLRPSVKSKYKTIPYECGLEPEEDAWRGQFLHYYFLALLFLVFEVEILFLFPWVVVYKELGLFSLIEVAIFIFILGVGILYYLKAGYLGWLR